MVLLNIALTFPIVDPVLKFLLILLIILFVPLLLNKIRIPYLLGLIIAGAVVGENGFNLIERDSSIILSGTAGLLYIMFLAGLEMDIHEFKKNSKKSIVFGLYTFSIPMLLGIFCGIYLLGFSLQTSILMSSMFATHTLLTYPLISKLGAAKNRAVTVTVGGTMITDTLALCVLAVIVAMNTGQELSTEFWLHMLLKFVAFVAIIVVLFPIIGRWFIKNFDDNISQYIFVLAMVFLGAFLAELAGLEGIIGAFLAGLALNKLIPKTSSLMSRIEFVGNAIFIPFFLLGVGMLVDYRAIFQDFETLKVAFIMTSFALIAKYVAAWATQKTFKFTTDERRLIFGLNPHAAATLALVLVGYNIGLFNDSILNGTIILILVTCTVASFYAQKGAKNVVLAESTEKKTGEVFDNEERILIPINRPEATNSLIDLSLAMKSYKSKSKLYSLNIIDNTVSDELLERKAKNILEKSAIAAAAADQELEPLIRYDINIVNALMSVVLEQKITDLILGLHQQKGFSQSFLGNLTNGILNKCNTTTMIYKYIQPLSTVKRHFIIVPDKAEEEIGFPFWLARVWNIAYNTGAKIVFYTTNQTFEYIKELDFKREIDYSFVEFNDWSNDMLLLSKDIRHDDNLIIVLSRKDRPSYTSVMSTIPNYLNKNYKNNGFILVFPMQEGVEYEPNIDFTNPTFLELGRLSKVGEIFQKILKLENKNKSVGE